jgi:Kef-type K+ transport system membrane component KefB
MSADDVLGRLLVDVAIVIALCRLLAVLLRRLGQPPVLAEILAGIALGPSLLGAIAPGLESTLFPAEVTQALSAIGTLGLVLFMFFVGLELDSSAMRGRRGAVARISFGSLALPFAGGLALALALHGAHDQVAGQEVPLAAFMLFLGTAMAVTAFPVLARILADHDLAATKIGTLATASAAIQDLTGWILLALALAVAEGSGAGSVALTVVEGAAIVAILFGAVRPFLRHSLGDGAEERELTDPTLLALLLVGLAGTAGATQLIGLHSAIGAFLFGLAFPREGLPRVLPTLQRTVTPLTMVVLLPVYFLGPGLSVDVGQIGGQGFLELAAIFAVACAAKWTGTAAAARASGYSRRDSTVLGVLLNTRGLVELIILNIGLSAGVLDGALYSEFVLMALLTTLMTGPLLRAAGIPQASRARWERSSSIERSVERRSSSAASSGAPNLSSSSSASSTS